MKARSFAVVGLVAALAAPLILRPQGTIKVRSQLVVVDVTVTRAHGHPVHGLKQSDFHVFENGKQQEIVAFQPHAFEPHALEPQAAQNAPSRLPKGIFSNVDIRSRSAPAINIILFDALNSSVEAQMNGRKQLVTFLKSLPPGQPTALFELRENLRMIASFSTDSNQLAAAAQKLVPYRSGWFVSEDQAEREAAKAGTIAESGPGSPPPPNIGALIKRVRARGLGQRLRITTKAFEMLSNVVAGYPGRKNLLWLSEGFPVRFSPQGVVPRPNVLASSTAARLASAQLAVYPIDSQGLATMGHQGSTPGQVAAGSGPAPVASMISTRQDLLREAQLAMENIAADTGGQAFSNTNNLTGALNRVFDAGSNYYTLAYVPTDGNWNGEFRHIQVTVRRKGLHLAYRKGYYASQWHPSRAESEQEFSNAMLPGIPKATMLPFKAMVRRTASKASVLIVGYYVAGDNVAFKDSKDGKKHARIKFVAVAYSSDGKSDDVASHTASLDLNPDQFTEIQRSGILFRQPLQLRPGDDNLRIGVLDEQTGSFGTLEVPVASLDIGH